MELRPRKRRPLRVSEAMRWGTGHTTKSELAEKLSLYEIPSKIGLIMDSVLIGAIFGQHSRKAPNRRHSMQSLAEESPKTDNTRRKAILTEFQTLKQGLSFQGDASGYLQTAEKISSALMGQFSEFNHSGEKAESTLTWLLAAYGMVVEGCSADVRLKVILTGGHLQFAVTATRDLPKGVYLYELAGIMAADTEALHSRLSEITPHRSQGKGTVPKILFGPARFVNHDCKNANVEFVAVVETSSFTMKTKQFIKEGDELYLDYGQEYFTDLSAGCPCLSCNPTDISNSLKSGRASGTRNLSMEKCKYLGGDRGAKREKNRANRRLRKVQG